MPTQLSIFALQFNESELSRPFGITRFVPQENGVLYSLFSLFIKLYVYSAGYPETYLLGEIR